MEVKQILHMNKGNGETSYANNSLLQRKIIYLSRRVMDEALKKLMMSNSEYSSIGIADLGCSSGPNSLLSVSNIVDTIHNLCSELDRPVPELSLSLNDLPGNDFNYIFASLPEFYDQFNKRGGGGGGGSCFVSAVPGSFYGRLFPRRSLHFVYSSSSLHWLSQVPCGEVKNENGMVTTSDLDNKGKIYLSKTSPMGAHKAYALQFQTDFSVFLSSRAEELVPGGRMVLSFIGRNSSDSTTEDSYHWELLGQALMSLANEGIIEEEKIDAFNVPFYAASSEELKMAIEKEGSFLIDWLEITAIGWEGESINDENYDLVRSKTEALASGRRMAKTMRAMSEPILVPMFGENVMDEVFERYAKIVGEYFCASSPRFASVIVSLIRMG